MIICLCAGLAGCATQATTEDTHSMTRSAEKTLSDFERDPEMKWFREYVRKAKAIVIAPQVVRAGFVFGGAGGSGVVVARGQGQPEWAGPAFYTIKAGSVGLQAGVQSAEVVMLIMNEKAFNSILSTSFKLGTDVSVAAGPVGAGMAAPIASDILVFSRAKGLYGGLNFEGSVISVNDKANAAYYGRQVTPVDILVRHSARNPEAAALLQTARRVASGGGASSY